MVVRAFLTHDLPSLAEEGSGVGHIARLDWFKHVSEVAGRGIDVEQSPDHGGCAVDPSSGCPVLSR